MIRLGSIIFVKELIMKEIIFTENAPKAIGPYSQAVLSNDTLYCSGQIALDKNGTLNNQNISDEINQMFENLNAILKQVDMDFSNVVKSTIFLKNMNDFNTINEIYGKSLTSTPLLEKQLKFQDYQKM